MAPEIGGRVELYTDKRKRLQIEIVRQIIFKLKERFNEEFKALEAEKTESIFKIKECQETINDSAAGYSFDVILCKHYEYDSVAQEAAMQSTPLAVEGTGRSQAARAREQAVVATAQSK